MNTVRGLLRLTRPDNWAIAAIAVIAGALTGPDPVVHWTPVVWAVVVAVLFTAGGMVLNDVADVEIDRVNKAHRPLPSGMVFRPAAITLAVVLMGMGVIALLPLPPVCRMIAFGSLGAIIIYDLWGSRQPFVGNLIVSIVSGLAFLLGSLVVGHGLWGAIPGVLTAFFILGREIIKDLEDMEADRQEGLRTLPLVAGEAKARSAARVVLTILIILLVIPVIAGWMRLPYLLIMVPGVGFPLLKVIVQLADQQDEISYRRIQRFLKWDMLAGLLAILVG
ncbi:geranylgeranylglycerol-phosphate geranylgeranyltransferase [Candidatus Zixiibacteriota bacterium]